MPEFLRTLKDITWATLHPRQANQAEEAKFRTQQGYAGPNIEGKSLREIHKELTERNQATVKPEVPQNNIPSNKL